MKLFQGNIILNEVGHAPQIYLFPPGNCGRIAASLPDDGQTVRFLAFRDLDGSEVALLRSRAVKRFYLPRLSEQDAADFRQEFGQFWDGLCEKFPKGHFFWRNVVSSKMQEWDASLGYLCLTLFVLSRCPRREMPDLAILVDSMEEVQVWEAWSAHVGWTVAERPRGLRACGDHVRQYLMDTGGRFWGGLVFFRRWLRYSKKNSSHKINKDIVIVSLAYASAFTKKGYKDHFFGVVHEKLKEFGKDCLYLVEPLGEHNRRDVEQQGLTDNLVTFTYELLTWRDILKVFFRVMHRGIKDCQAVFMSCPMRAVIARNSRRLLVGHNYYAEIMYEAMLKLLSRSRPKTVVIVFEGNVMERAVIQAAYRLQPGTVRLVGYSHAAIYPLCLKFMVSSKESGQRPEPDAFLACGEGNASALASIGGRGRATILVGCSFKESWEGEVPQPPGQPTCLVALDGNGRGSCVAMLEWLIEKRLAFKGFRVFVRPHPNISEEYIRGQLMAKIPDNFQFSHLGLTDDIASATVVIYRSSSVGLQALLRGVPVIRLAVAMPLLGDIIDRPVAGWYEAITEADLDFALKQASAIGRSGRERVREEANKVFGRYFIEQSRDGIRAFSEAIEGL